MAARGDAGLSLLDVDRASTEQSLGYRQNFRERPRPTQWPSALSILVAADLVVEGSGLKGRILPRVQR
jgi:hypothetical protein